jgi:hypothetical protein
MCTTSSTRDELDAVRWIVGFTPKLLYELSLTSLESSNTSPDDFANVPAGDDTGVFSSFSGGIVKEEYFSMLDFLFSTWELKGGILEAGGLSAQSFPCCTSLRACATSMTVARFLVLEMRPFFISEGEIARSSPRGGFSFTFSAVPGAAARPGSANLPTMPCGL